MSNNLNITALTTGQTGKEARINASLEAVDAALTENMDVNLTSGNVTLSSADFRGNAAFIVKNATTAGRQITVPAIAGWKVFCNDSSNTQDITLAQGSSAVIMAVGISVMVYSDGTTNGLHSAGSGS